MNFSSQLDQRSVNSGVADQSPDEGPSANRPLLRWFVLSAGLVLTITGIAKVWTAFGDSKLLAVVDPIFGIKFGQLMLAVGVAEIVIALCCFFSKRPSLALALVAWISTSFVVYRLGLHWMDWHRPCNCLGNLTDALGISAEFADNISKGLLAYLMAGSLWLLLRGCNLVNGRTNSTTSDSDKTAGAPSTIL